MSELPTREFLTRLVHHQVYTNGKRKPLVSIRVISGNEKLYLGYLELLCQGIEKERETASRIRQEPLANSWHAAHGIACQIYDKLPVPDVLINHLAKHGNSVDAPLMWGFVNAGKKEEAYEQGYKEGVQKVRKQIVTEAILEFSDGELDTLSIDLQEPITGEDAEQSDSRRAMLAMVQTEIERRRTGKPLPANERSKGQIAPSSVASWSITKINQVASDKSHPLHDDARTEWTKRILEAEPSNPAVAEEISTMSKSNITVKSWDNELAQAESQWAAMGEAAKAEWIDKDTFVSAMAVELRGNLHRSRQSSNSVGSENQRSNVSTAPPVTSVHTSQSGKQSLSEKKERATATAKQEWSVMSHAERGCWINEGIFVRARASQLVQQ